MKRQTENSPYMGQQNLQAKEANYKVIPLVRRIKSMASHFHHYALLLVGNLIVGSRVLQMV